MLIERWRQRRARKRADAAAEAEKIKQTAWAIFHAVADPLVAEGLARLSEPVTAGFSKFAEPDQWIGIQPVREGPAAVAISCVGTAWIDFAVGEPFPVGAVYELETSSAGWEEELRLCLEAVVDGRYVDRLYESKRGHEVWEMIFALPTEKKTIPHVALSGSGYDRPLGEYRYHPYRT